MTENAKKNIIVRPALIPAIRKGRLFCDVCMQKILDRKKEKQRQEDGNE